MSERPEAAARGAQAAGRRAARGIAALDLALAVLAGLGVIGALVEHDAWFYSPQTGRGPGPAGWTFILDGSALVLLLGGFAFVERGLLRAGGWAPAGLRLGALGSALVAVPALVGLAVLASGATGAARSADRWLGFPKGDSCFWPSVLLPLGLALAIANLLVLDRHGPALRAGPPTSAQEDDIARMDIRGRVAATAASNAARDAALSLVTWGFVLGTVVGTVGLLLLVAAAAQPEPGEKMRLAGIALSAILAWGLLAAGRARIRKGAEGRGQGLLLGLFIAGAGSVLSTLPIWIPAVASFFDAGPTGPSPGEFVIIAAIVGSPAVLLAAAHVLVILRHGPAIRAGLARRHAHSAGPIGPAAELPTPGGPEAP
ncbi:MAG: hypothetical protein L0216_16300 [Planctomycetales bacterium]|nr:hypothetical protein [Planctomycetales bacterium]